MRERQKKERNKMRKRKQFFLNFYYICMFWLILENATEPAASAPVLDVYMSPPRYSQCSHVRSQPTSTHHPVENNVNR